MIQRLAIIGALIVTVIFFAMQNQSLRTERNLIADRLEAIGGAREIENVTRQIDDCGLFGLLTSSIDVHTKGGAVLGCAADATYTETGNGGLHHPE